MLGTTLVSGKITLGTVSHVFFCINVLYADKEITLSLCLVLLSPSTQYCHASYLERGLELIVAVIYYVRVYLFISEQFV